MMLCTCTRNGIVHWRREHTWRGRASRGPAHHQPTTHLPGLPCCTDLRTSFGPPVSLAAWTDRCKLHRARNKKGNSTHSARWPPTTSKIDGQARHDVPLSRSTRMTITISFRPTCTATNPTMTQLLHPRPRPQQPLHALSTPLAEAPRGRHSSLPPTQPTTHYARE
jgi:hypothetical protein